MFKQIESLISKVLSFQVLNHSKQSSIINTDTIKNLNSRNKATSITRYHFSTLHTNITHWKLIRILNEHTYFCFKVGDEEFIAVDRYGAQGSNRQKTGAESFTKSSLKKGVKYLLGTCYFKLGNKIF